MIEITLKINGDEFGQDISRALITLADKIMRGGRYDYIATPQTFAFPINADDEYADVFDWADAHGIEIPATDTTVHVQIDRG